MEDGTHEPVFENIPRDTRGRRDAVQIETLTGEKKCPTAARTSVLVNIKKPSDKTEPVLPNVA